MTGFGRNAVVLAFVAIVSACSQTTSSDIATRTSALEGFTPQEIYAQGEQRLSVGDANEAALLFSEVERLYPFSEWARRALIMQAFSHHQAQDYLNSRATAQRFIDFYPADSDAAYAQYLLALSYYDQIDDVGRDQGVTVEALRALNVVIERYPNSEYAAPAKARFDLAFDHLAGKEMEIGRFYLKQGQYGAAINRFRTVVEDFQTTSHTPEALHRLVEAYLSLGLVAEAQTAGAILGFNYQGSPWYQDSFALLTGQGLELRDDSEGWLGQIYRQMVRGEWI